MRRRTFLRRQPFLRRQKVLEEINVLEKTNVLENVLEKKQKQKISPSGHRCKLFTEVQTNFGVTVALKTNKQKVSVYECVSCIQLNNNIIFNIYEMNNFACLLIESFNQQTTR